MVDKAVNGGISDVQIRRSNIPRKVFSRLNEAIITQLAEDMVIERINDHNDGVVIPSYMVEEAKNIVDRYIEEISR